MKKKLLSIILLICITLNCGVDYTSASVDTYLYEEKVKSNTLSDVDVIVATYPFVEEISKSQSDSEMVYLNCNPRFHTQYLG